MVPQCTLTEKLFHVKFLLVFLEVLLEVLHDPLIAVAVVPTQWLHHLVVVVLDLETVLSGQGRFYCNFNSSKMYLM